ncbi:MAG: PKD domain-containing protein [Puia sp.]
MEIQLYTQSGFVVFSSVVKRIRNKADKLLLLSCFLCIQLAGLAQTTNLTFTQIPLTDPEFMRPGAGANEWTGDQNIVNIPVQGTNTQRLDRYWRFTWLDFQAATVAAGSYNFSVFDSKIQESITKGQTFSFGIMQQCGGCDANQQTSMGGATMLYPNYLHTQMQGESTKDFTSGGEWFPNYNSPSYLTAWKNLNVALNAHIMSGSYNGVRYQDVIGQIDVRGYGDYGEWTNNVFTVGNITVATGDSIISYVVHSFDKFQCVYMMAACDGGQLTSNTNVPPGVGYYALTTSNSAGKLGWRRDSWGQTDGYLSQWTDTNPTTFNGLSFKTEIMNRYQFAPIVGEPQDGGSAGNFTSLAAQMTKYGVTSFGNGNFNNGVNATIQNSFRAASKAAGYRIVLTGGSMTTTLTGGSSFNLSLNWQNIGAAPDYKNWNVTFELRNSSNAVVWSGTSSFNPRLFLPSGSPSAISDNFTLPSTVPQGTYSMYLIIRDPVGFRKPLPLGITGVNSDGSYLVRSNITVGTGTGNQSPVANAGSDQTITLPTATASLAGTGTDADGSIASYSWTQTSGPAGGVIATPNTANTSITGLTQGVYVFTLTVKDNQGATATDNVQVTVNAATAPANNPPVVNAGADQTIQLPTSTVSLTGTGTDADGTIASYAWTKSSGPAGGTITTPATATTNITGLLQGVYIFTCTVTDNQGAQATDNVQITVNAATAPANQLPVANAGSDQTIQLPTSTVSLTGTGTDADGTIASYSWTKLSGPAIGTMSTPSAASTNITGLVQGIYVFTLTVTDNQGGKTSDNIQVTVNAAVPANKPPVANAGADFNITLPVNSVNLSGTASTDPDGSIATYLWTKLSGPAQFTIGNSGSASTTASNLAAGVYLIQLKVTDNQGAISQDTVKIIVNAAPVNQPPVANAGADMSITLPLTTANLNGASSSDPDGTISIYNWTQVSGPSQSSITSPANSSTDVTGLVQGVYVFSLKVTDNSGASSSDVISVTVNPAANIPPVANAGSSKSITLPTNSTTLDGSLSSDADGSISAYSWAQISGPGSSTITNGNTSVVTVSDLVAGQYTYELTVTDNMGATAKSRVKITVSNSGIQPPVANAGADQTITLPVNTAIIDGSGSSASSGSIVSFNWVEKSGPSIVNLTNSAQNTVSSLQAGNYVFLLTVTDQNGATGTDSVQITVEQAINKAPVANAGTGANIALPTNSINLDGSKSYDPDGTISTYSWTRIAGPNTPTTTGSNTSLLSLSGLVAGTYTYQLTVTDNSGASSSSRVKVIVTAAANRPPNANAGPNQQITAPASSVTLNGSGSSDPDGNIATYSWTAVSGPGSVTINNSNTATPSVVGLKPGGYIFELTVTDNNGATAKDQVTVTVLPQPLQANQAPVANAGNNQTITAPLNSVVLNGNSSFDPDGTIASYSWRQVSGPSASSIAAAKTSSATVSKLIVGQYVFELTVTDNNGSANSDQVTITVNPAAAKVNLLPVADAGSSDTIQLPTNTYTLNASGSMDPDGTIVSYHWQQVSGPNTASSSSMNNQVVTLSNLQAGEYAFQLTVTDNTGITSTATMNLTVEQGITQNNVSSTERFIVYPNPAHDVTTAKITSQVTGTVKITVYDMNGRQVLVAQTVKMDDVATKTLNISSLASGMYTVQISIGNKKTMVTKFIKN